MNIIQPYAKMKSVGLYMIDKDDYLVDMLGAKIMKVIEAIGRVSHRSEDRVTDDSWYRFIETVVLQHGDWSITEHISVIVEAVVDRGITHEWVRHRLGAYTQESTRFVNYAKKMEPSFIAPPFQQDLDDAVNGQTAQGVWEKAMELLEDAYQELVDTHKVAPQLARSVFPNSLASKLIVTYNLRNWRHFFLMRTSKEAHPQMREVTIPLLAEFKSIIPLLYDDIQPNMRQIDNMRLPR